MRDPHPLNSERSVLSNAFSTKTLQKPDQFPLSPRQQPRIRHTLPLGTQELNLDADSTEATLTGTTFGGQAIQGSDTVNIVPLGK